MEGRLHVLHPPSLLLSIRPGFSLAQPSLDPSGVDGSGVVGWGGGVGWEAEINVPRLPSGGRYEYSGFSAFWRPQVGCC